jgi:hypothetical protein
VPVEARYSATVEPACSFTSSTAARLVALLHEGADRVQSHWGATCPEPQWAEQSYEFR